MFNFGKNKIMFYECKDYALTRAVEMHMKPEIKLETKTHFEMIFHKGIRQISVSIFKDSGAPLTIDVHDSYFLLRVPRKTFTNSTKYKEFINELLLKIDQANIQRP